MSIIPVKMTDWPGVINSLFIQLQYRDNKKKKKKKNQVNSNSISLAEGDTAPQTKLEHVCALYQNYQHFFEK